MSLRFFALLLLAQVHAMNGGGALEPHQGLKPLGSVATEPPASKRQHHRGKGTSPRSPASSAQAAPSEDPALHESRLVFTSGDGTYYRRACWVNDLERRSEGRIREIEKHLLSERLCVYELGSGHNCSEMQYVESRSCRPVTLHAAQASLASLLSKDRALSALLRRLKEGPRAEGESLLSVLPLCPQSREQSSLLASLCRWAVLKWVLALLRLEVCMAEEQGLHYTQPHMRLARTREHSCPLAFYQRERAYADYYRRTRLAPPPLPSASPAPAPLEVLDGAAPVPSATAMDEGADDGCSVGSKAAAPRPARRGPRSPRAPPSPTPCGPPVAPMPVFLRIQLLYPFTPLDRATLHENRAHWEVVDAVSAYTLHHAHALYTCCAEARANEALCPRRQGSDREYYACGLPVVLALHALLPPTSPWRAQVTAPLGTQEGESEEGRDRHEDKRAGGGGQEQLVVTGGEGERKGDEVGGEEGGHRRLPKLPPTSP